MNTPDFINACFEAFAVFVTCLNIHVILKDKCVKGVSIWPTAVFCLWGFWNIVYHGKLNQYISAAVAGFVGLSNLTWLVLALVYKFEEKLKQEIIDEYRRHV